MEYRKSCIDAICALADAPGVSGFEDAVIKEARTLLDDRFRVEEDSLRNLYIYRKRDSGNRPVLMLDAHSDEVGFMIHSIKPNGTLRVVTLGGITASFLPFSKVLVRTRTGEYIPGIFASKPPHFMSASEKSGNVSIGELVIDIGASSYREAVEEYGVRMGEPVLPCAKTEFDAKHGIFFGKAFDCRIGCAALIETLLRTADTDFPMDIVGVLSSQEEVGERGCKVAVNHVKPSAAVCFEGCPADDTFSPDYAIQSAMYKGPMFRHLDCSVICNPRFQRFTLDLAQSEGIPVQESVREGGGNNAATIQHSLEGIPSVVAGIPVRYTHSMNCMAAYEDYENTVCLIMKMMEKLTPELVSSF